MIFDKHRYDVHWRFVQRAEGEKAPWHWEVRTRSGVLVARSSEGFDSHGACEQDASRHGYSAAHAA